MNSNQSTTYQRALTQARKLQPEVNQINNSLFFDCASTSTAGAWHHVTLGPNRFNPYLMATCDCGGTTRYKACCHLAAAFLQYTANLEARLHRGCDYITEQESQGQDSSAAFELWQDLLTRYENNCDLLRAIEAGWNISELAEPFKERLDIALKTPDKEFQLLTA